MTITVLGTGFVGLTTATLFAQAGNKVYAVEPLKERLDAVKEGRSFFFEEGLDPLIAEVVKNGNLIPTDSYEESVPESDVVFSCVGTPDNPDGSSNLSYVFASAESSAKLMQPDAVFVQKSTVPVGTGERIEGLFKSLGKKNAYVSNPEFLRESTALFDTLFFDRVVVGGNDQKATEKVLDLYRELEKQRAEIAKKAGIETVNRKGEYITTTRNSAELIKVTSNAFLAMKISFANSIAKLADRVDADINEVMNAVGADPRIGRAFLNAGRGYGGGCFPKDVSGLISSGLEHGVELDIMIAAQAVNQSMPGYLVEKLQEAFEGTLRDKRVAVLGLAFKSGTSDTRKSPGVALANILAKAGAKVTAYDPEANGEAKLDLRRSVDVKDSLDKAVEGAEAVIIATDWPAFVELAPSEYAKQLPKNGVLVDAMNRLDEGAVTKAGLQYVGVGRGVGRA
jgi:UDPglucose 6-dehydrogenase